MLTRGKFVGQNFFVNTFVINNKPRRQLSAKLNFFAINLSREERRTLGTVATIIFPLLYLSPKHSGAFFTPTRASTLHTVYKCPLPVERKKESSLHAVYWGHYVSRKHPTLRFQLTLHSIKREKVLTRTLLAPAERRKFHLCSIIWKYPRLKRSIVSRIVSRMKIHDVVSPRQHCSCKVPLLRSRCESNFTRGKR